MAVHLGKTYSCSHTGRVYGTDMLLQTLKSHSSPMFEAYFGPEKGCRDTPCVPPVHKTNCKHIFSELYNICSSYCSVCICVANELNFYRKWTHFQAERGLKQTLSGSINFMEIGNSRAKRFQIIALFFCFAACKQSLYWGWALLVNEASVHISKAADGFRAASEEACNKFDLVKQEPAGVLKKL